ncbi:hypothetical protein [Microcoleus sp. B4-D4]|uniref:hypothetical protein n=1 Tax=Microcoleus sp. B4-D4 TaxID=2818667 RepID=UPI002FD59E78
MTVKKIAKIIYQQRLQAIALGTGLSRRRRREDRRLLSQKKVRETGRRQGGDWCGSEMVTFWLVAKFDPAKNGDKPPTLVAIDLKF